MQNQTDLYEPKTYRYVNRKSPQKVPPDCLR